MITTMEWGKHTLRLIRLGERDLLLLDDLARALGMNSEELIAKVSNKFKIVHYIKDDPAIEDGAYFFLTRRGVYQALWMVETEEALIFQDFASLLIRLYFIGPTTKNDFEFLDSFVPKKTYKGI